MAFVAMAASSALPPPASTRSPAAVASRWGLATAPPRRGWMFGDEGNRAPRDARALTPDRRRTSLALPSYQFRTPWRRPAHEGLHLGRHGGDERARAARGDLPRAAGLRSCLPAHGRRRQRR